MWTVSKDLLKYLPGEWNAIITIFCVRHYPYSWFSPDVELSLRKEAHVEPQITSEWFNHITSSKIWEVKHSQGSIWCGCRGMEKMRDERIRKRPDGREVISSHTKLNISPQDQSYFVLEKSLEFSGHVYMCLYVWYIIVYSYYENGMMTELKSIKVHWLIAWPYICLWQYSKTGEGIKLSHSQKFNTSLWLCFRQWQ